MSNSHTHILSEQAETNQLHCLSKKFPPLKLSVTLSNLN